MRRLFEGGVYSRAAFIRGNTVFIRVYFIYNILYNRSVIKDTDVP